MKKLSVFVLLMSFFLKAGVSQGSETFIFYPGSEFSIVEKQDLRKRINGKYEGFIYRETRCYLREEESEKPGSAYTGNVYVFEEMKRNTRLLGRRVEESYPLKIGFSPRGEYIIDSRFPYPALRGVPTFSDKPVSPGDRWQASGERVLFAQGQSSPTRVNILCEYLFNGVKGSGDDAFYSINGQYAIRYRGGDPDGDPLLKTTDGSHKIEIRVPLSDEGKIFIRDTVEEQYRMKDGSLISYSGVILTWFDSPSGWSRTETKDLIAENIESRSTEDLSEGIELTENSEGLILTLPDVHFVPDKAQILPDEKGRIDAIAEILKRLPGRASFLVRGHTADIGTKESQMVLSEQRAEVIVQELTLRGIPGERLLFEGKGGTVPLGDNATEEGRKKNRRVEILILN